MTVQSAAILCVVYSYEVTYFKMEKMEADTTVIGNEQCSNVTICF